MLLYNSIKVNIWLELSPSELAGYRILVELYVVNNIVNPFIYGFFYTQFRDEVSKKNCHDKKV